MECSPVSVAAPPEAWAVYAGKVMYFAFVARGGSVHTANSSTPAALTHPAISGHLLVADRSPELLALIRAAPTAQALCAALKSAGFEVKRTPLSALSWALPGVK